MPDVPADWTLWRIRVGSWRQPSLRREERGWSDKFLCDQRRRFNFVQVSGEQRRRSGTDRAPLCLVGDLWQFAVVVPGRRL